MTTQLINGNFADGTPNGWTPVGGPGYAFVANLDPSTTPGGSSYAFLIGNNANTGPIGLTQTFDSSGPGAETLSLSVLGLGYNQQIDVIFNGSTILELNDGSPLLNGVWQTLTVDVVSTGLLDTLTFEGWCNGGVDLVGDFGISPPAGTTSVDAPADVIGFLAVGAVAYTGIKFLSGRRDRTPGNSEFLAAGATMSSDRRPGKLVRAAHKVLEATRDLGSRFVRAITPSRPAPAPAA